MKKMSGKGPQAKPLLQNSSRQQFYVVTNEDNTFSMPLATLVEKLNSYISSSVREVRL